VDTRADFDESEIRAAERRLETSLGSSDPTAWVYDYTEDAVFDGGDHAVVGREALLDMARSMRALREISIRPLRTEGRDGLVTVWAEASWTGVSDEGGASRVEVRGILLWRREADGVWRVAMEHLG
jgi:ketosteroid isomerase-like protein